MKDCTFTVKSLRILTDSVFELNLEGDASDFTRPGQFVNITIPSLYLRRPISVCDWTENSICLLIREVGAGTKWLHNVAIGTPLQVITDLGNGFDIDFATTSPALVGGGIGIAPLYGLARKLLEKGIAPTVILGYRNASEIFYAEEFRNLGCKVIIATEDGSVGVKGFVTDALKTCPELSQIYACGPMPMLKALALLPQVKDGEFSLEARMGCGFGACVGCTIMTKNGPARVCAEGPVFRKEEIVW